MRGSGIEEWELGEGKERCEGNITYMTYYITYVCYGLNGKCHTDSRVWTLSSACADCCCFENLLYIW